MTGKRVCVTNDVPDLRSCVVRGVHKSNCDGFLRRYDRETGQTELAYRIAWNPETRENDRWLIDCPGCLPRQALQVVPGVTPSAYVGGLLCESHGLKLEHALDTDPETGRVLVDLVTHLWSIESGGVRDDNDRVSSAFGSQWPLSASHLAANEIYTELAAVCVAFANDLRVDEPEFSAAASILDGFLVDMDIDIVAVLTRRLVEYIEQHAPAAIKRKHSAEAVVRLINTIQAAMTKFPLVDVDHRVPHVRCPSCSRMSLVWKPPLMHLGDVVIKCEACGHEENQDWFEEYVHLVKTDPRRRTA